MHSFLWIVVGFHAGLTYIQHWSVQEKEINHESIKNRSKKWHLWLVLESSGAARAVSAE